MVTKFSEPGTTLRNNQRIVTVLLWIALSTGLAVSIFSLVEELCMATACSDAASFVFFGVGMALFGCAYFSVILVILFLRRKNAWFGLILTAMVFSGVGAELRLLWIQKYIIGSWCPLCVTICCCLFFSAVLLLIERVLDRRAGDALVSTTGWVSLVTTMIAVGLAVAVMGVKALS